jgi:hypothetical protein
MGRVRGWRGTVGNLSFFLSDLSESIRPLSPAETTEADKRQGYLSAGSGSRHLVFLSKLVVLIQGEVPALLDTAGNTPNPSFNSSCRGPTTRTSKFVQIQFRVVCREAEHYPGPTLVAWRTFHQDNLFGNHGGEYMVGEARAKKFCGTLLR